MKAVISKQTKVFEVDGRKMRFNAIAFVKICKEYRKRKNITSEDLDEKLAELVGLSISAVQNWKKRLNGPGDLDYIVKMAEYLECSNYLVLLEDVKENISVEKLRGRQIDSCKRVYDAVLDFLSEFESTDGFNDLWYVFKKKGETNPEDAINDYASQKIDAVLNILNKEQFYLGKHEIFEELWDYIENDLMNTFEGKVSYAYRFEAPVDGNPSTWDDYRKALDRINQLVGNYISESWD